MAAASTCSSRYANELSRNMRPPAGRGGRIFGRSNASGRGVARFSGAGRGRGRGQFRDDAPPATIEEIGILLHACEGEIVCKSTNKRIPYFNGGIYLENKTQVGKIEEIFGPVDGMMFTVKLLEGIQANSYAKGATFYISSDKLLPIERFTNPAGPSRPRGGRTPGGRSGRGSGRSNGRGRAGRSARGNRGRF